MFKFFKTFGSGNHFNELVAHLVGTSSSPAIMNGSSSNVFKPSKGFRQGCPLSPIDFVIVVETLGRSIMVQLSKGLIVGLKPSSDDLPYSHEQFYDNMIMMGEYSIKEGNNFKDFL